MGLSRWAWAILLLAGADVVQADRNEKKGTNDVMVLLRERSNIRMECLQDQIDIDTKFGKLSVPVSSIRRIDFGLHIDQEQRAKIESLIKQLGDTDFAKREQAAKDLFALGPMAYADVVKAAKSTDATVAKLAATVKERMGERYPENELLVKTDDTIVTDLFPIVGRICTEKLKTRTSIFGEKEIKISDIQSMRWVGRIATVDVTLEATKVLMRPNVWIDTGIMVEPDDQIEIKADGSVNVNVNAGQMYEVGPEGADPMNLVNPVVAGQNVGAVIGRIGEGEWFLIGSKYNGTLKKPGKLYLSMGRSPWAGGGTQVSGSFKVTISGGREAN